MIFCIYSGPYGNVRLVGGDVPVDYEGVCGDFINLNLMCHLSLSEELIGLSVVRAFIGWVMLVSVSIFDCIVLKKYRSVAS